MIKRFFLEYFLKAACLSASLFILLTFLCCGSGDKNKNEDQVVGEIDSHHTGLSERIFYEGLDINQDIDAVELKVHEKLEQLLFYARSTENEYLVKLVLESKGSWKNFFDTQAAIYSQTFGSASMANSAGDAYYLFLIKNYLTELEMLADASEE